MNVIKLFKDKFNNKSEESQVVVDSVWAFKKPNDLKQTIL